jgi:U3 small nucleolar RNA-associated protein 20
MPAPAFGAVSRTARRQQSTPSSNKHVFEPFTKRIARLKIDPIHSIVGRTAIDDNDELSHSFFRSALEEWSSLNLTTTFTSFLRTVNPLCETLPQLLHHAGAIFTALVTHIEKRDTLALEPLLSLTAHFAHDLGHKFEQYFGQIVSLVADVAAGQDAPDAVEWCFTCLAWMFKYLSRLLVQDLRPLLKIFKPYLFSKKEYISRFSAESLAFLLRKAAVSYPKKKAPLLLATNELLDTDGYSRDQVENGVVTLLTETCLGVDTQLHTGATYVFKCLLEAQTPSDGTTGHQLLVQITLISVMHETDRDSFAPIVDTVIDYLSQKGSRKDSEGVSFALSLLQVIIATRKGSRVASWNPIVSAYLSTRELSSELRSGHGLGPLQAVGAVLLQYAPMSALLPASLDLLDLATKGLSPRQYFSFCTLVADLGMERFHDLLLPHLQQFIITRQQDDELALIYALDQLRGRGVITPRQGRAGYLSSTGEWEQSISHRLNASSPDAVLNEAYLTGVCTIPNAIRFPVDAEAGHAIHEAMKSQIMSALTDTEMDLPMNKRIILGWMLEAFVSSGPSRTDLEELWSQIWTSSRASFKLLPFLRASNCLAKDLATPSMPSADIADKARGLLISNMLSASVPLRQESLGLLGRLHDNDDATQTIDLLLKILSITYLPANARQIAMLLRKLPQRQKVADSSLEKLIPFFCLGLLPQYHDQSRKELSRVLGELVVNTGLEDTVLDIVVSWLRTQDLPQDSASGSTQPLPKPSHFQDSNNTNVNTVIEQVSALYDAPEESLVKLASEAHALESTRTPSRGRSVALTVLVELLDIVEKRSRLLTPVFLAAQFTRTTHDNNAPHDSSESSSTVSPDVHEGAWSLAERKAFIGLYTQFKNPKVLYRSTEVYEKLFDLLSNGNAEIRKQSLLAVLRWKGAVLLKYEDMLLKVVDEKIPSAELGVMLNVEAQENPIKPDERPIVLPVLLRLIYGLIVGRSGSHGSQESRRKTLLRMLFRMQQSEVILFLDVALGQLRAVKQSSISWTTECLDREITSPDQRYGFLRMMNSLLETMGEQFAPYANHILDAVLYCTLRACKRQNADGTVAESLEKNIRKAGQLSLIGLLNFAPHIEWQKYMPSICKALITPRLGTFAIENAQSVSTTLRLIASWCQHPAYIRFLTAYDERLLPAIWQTLESNVTKEVVKIFILDEMLMPLVREASQEASEIDIRQIVQSQVSAILQSIQSILSSAPPTKLLSSVSTLLLGLAPLVENPEAASMTTSLLVTLLLSSKHRLSPLVKSNVLEAIHAMLQLPGLLLPPEIANQLQISIAALFEYFKDSRNRVLLCKILKLRGREDEKLDKAATICEDLNATSQSRLDEVDYDRRLAAFQQLSNMSIGVDAFAMWRPVLHNLIFFVYDDDFSIRSNATSALRSFINRVAVEESDTGLDIMRDVLMPAFQKGLTADSEVIRGDFMTLYGMLVQHLPDAQLQNMKSLLVGNDEEASFFTNILHIQQHRRVRAIRRLVTEVETGEIDSKNVAQVFLPILHKFIRDQGSEDSVQSTRGQSLAALRPLLLSVSWKQFKAIFKQYKLDLEHEEGAQKTGVKLLSQATDALLQAMSEKKARSSDDRQDGLSHLARTLPDAGDLSQEVTEHLLTKLADFVHFKDEAEMSARLPAATIAVKLVKLLPVAEGQIVSAPIILDVCNVLKSRAQESRDAGRQVLVETVELLGAESMQFVLRQMRSVLQRGYQLHVLSYTMHAVLVRLSPALRLSDLDYCVSDLVAVIMDDIFGAVGHEKDDDDYVSSMKEVKRQKSFDSMELIARCTSLDHLMLLIQPIMTVLSGSLPPKKVRQADELLRRLGMGISRNESAGERGLLVFSYQAIQNFYKEKAAAPVRPKTNDELNRSRFLLQKAASRSIETTGSLLYKIARFAIDLVRSALVKHSALLTPENVHGFLPVIGDALLEGQEDVKISALRLLSAVIKLRMTELDENCPFYVKEAVAIVRNCTSTNEEIAQAALKVIAAVLRERKGVKIRDMDIAEVLKRIAPDLDEPDRQGVTFNFIRAVLARKYEMPEIYDLVDKIAVMMVTSHGPGARDVARGVYVHFLVEYPQSSNRWAKQEKFLIKNLEYKYPEGRKSVMEAVNMLLNKVDGDAVQPLVAAFFLPIVLRMANDENELCRELAGALLGQLFTKADRDRKSGLLEPLEGWIRQEENIALTILSLQTFTIFFQVMEEGFDAQVRLCRDTIKRLLAMQSDEEDDDELQYEALRLMSVLCETRSSALLSPKSEALWALVPELMSHRQIRVRTRAVSLVRTFLGSCPSSAVSKLPLFNTNGLRLDANALRIVLKTCIKLIKTNDQDKALAGDTAELLDTLTSIVAASGLTLPVKAVEPTDDDEVDDSDSDNPEQAPQGSIPATQYILDQLSYIIRRETRTLSTQALLPKTTALHLLTTIIPSLPPSTLPQITLSTLLLPLIHLTSTSAATPHSADPTFADTYAALTTSAQELLGLLHEKVGDKDYIAAMTAASRQAKEKREERRRKRVIERVADPEAAARAKRKKADRTKSRRKEIGQQFVGRRKARGW